jgi:hypothetical protein
MLLLILFCVNVRDSYTECWWGLVESNQPSLDRYWNGFFFKVLQLKIQSTKKNKSIAYNTWKMIHSSFQNECRFSQLHTN